MQPTAATPHVLSFASGVGRVAEASLLGEWLGNAHPGECQAGTVGRGKGWGYPQAFPCRWLFTQAVCTLYAFCGVLFGLCSLSSLTVLSTVCCLKVCYPAYGRCWDVLSELYLHSVNRNPSPFFFCEPDPPFLAKLCPRTTCAHSIQGCSRL